jgi:Domain of unknown function (DUF222)
MAERAGHGNGQGAAPRREPGLPGDGVPGPGPDLAGLRGFASDGEWDTCPPSAALAVALEAASGPGQRCAGASRDEMFGLLRQWQALESWAVAGKLAVLRALVRDDDEPLPGGGYQGDLPEGWTKSLTHEVAAALSMPAVSAEQLMWLAWDLRARLPGTGALLAAGALTYGKARAVQVALQQLTDEDAAAAEAMIVPELPGKTHGQVARLAEAAAVTVDPGSAARRREDAEKNKSRVHMYREESGAAALAGRDMPAGQTLAAHASVCARARAQAYKDSGAFGDGIRMDAYRVAAYLDLLNDVTLDERIASGILPSTSTSDAGGGGETSDGGESPATGPGSPGTGCEPAAGPGPDGRGCACRECDGSCLPPDDERGDEPGDGVPGDEGPHGGPSQGGPGTSGAQPDGDASSSGSGSAPGEGQSGRQQTTRPPASAGTTPPRLADLVLPLATLLGLAERPGEGHGLGPLDPGLCRELATAATASDCSLLCITVTDPDGIAIGHGCARAPRRATPRAPAGHGSPARPGPACGPAALPARVNLTISSARLAELARTTGAPGPGPWTLTRDNGPGPPGGYGTWTLTLPGGSNLTAQLQPVPTFECDHRYESRAYQPNDTLRHLVQIRDGTCTFPPCNRHARESDFEHAQPYDKGGRTCACNAGARSRACHRIKQSTGWNVTQPRPGWHHWTTPSGRTYIQGPKRYPA